MKKNIPLLKVPMPLDVFPAVTSVLRSGWVTEGPKVKEFEEVLCNFLQVKQGLALNCCTSALFLACKLAGLNPGDEVISTPLTCVATNLPLVNAGARIVWADCDPTTGNIDPESIKTKITPKTKGIMVVHWGGYPADLQEIHQIASKNKLVVIEDAAHALGAEYHGKPIGNHSHFVCFSFQAVKHITTGDGGFLVCQDENDHRRGKLLRWFGIDREARKTETFWEYDITECGYKYHMNDIAASIGIAQMKHIREFLAIRERNARLYDEQLQGVPGIQLLTRKSDRKSANWLYTLLVDSREEFCKKLRSYGIQTSIVHPRNDTYTAFKPFAVGNDALPNVNEFEARKICLPVGHWVSEKDAEFIINTIKSGW